jgi:DNA-binding CsgD family transcriptional regulator
MVTFESDSPRAVLFRGDPGIGKTALLEIATSIARDNGARVITVRGSEYESDLAYSGLNQAVSAHDPYTDLVGPQQAEALQVVFGSTSRAELPDRLSVFSAITALIAAAARQQTLLFCLDDVQWIDQVSLEGFLFAARRLAGARANMLLAARARPGWLEEVPGVRVHRVEPLSYPAANALLRGRFPELPVRLRERMLADAQGNPLALLELPQTLEDRHLIGSDQISTYLPLSRRLQAIFAERIESLPRETRELLLASALEGTGDLNVLQRALGPRILRHIEAAEDAGIVTLSATGDKLSFRHPLTRSAVAEGASAAERRDAHRKLAKALAPDIDRSARHLAAATIEPDEEVARILQAAARRAAERGPDGDDAAMALLIRSADLSPSIEDKRKRMAEAAFVGAFRGGTAVPAPDVLERVPDPSPGSDESLWAASAKVFVGAGRGADLPTLYRLQDSVLDAAVAIGNTSSGAYLTAVETYIYMCVVSNDPERDERFVAWANAIPEALRPRRFTMFSAMLDPARSAGALIPLVLDAIEEASSSRDPRLIVNACSAAVYVDLLPACRPFVEEFLESESDSDGQRDLPTRLMLSLEAFQTGRWDAAMELTREGLTISQLRESQIYTAQFNYRQGLIFAARGESDSTAICTKVIFGTAPGRGYIQLENLALHVLVIDAMGRGDYPAAFEAAARISRPGELARSVPIALRVFLDLVHSAVMTGRVSEARRHVETLQRLHVAAISSRYAMMVTACEALLLDRNRESATLLAPHLTDGINDAWPFDLARVRLIQAEFATACGHPAIAREHAEKALQAFRSLGAQPWVVIAARLLQQLDPTTATTNHLSLTPTEIRVVRLAASGMTNKQIGEELYLSDRTVGSHLYRAFPKLGISRRAALRDAVEKMDRENC